MKGTDLLILKAELGLTSNAVLAHRLGIGERTLYKLLPKERLTHQLSLAAAALVAGLEPYSPPDKLTPDMQLRIEAESASTLRWLEQRLIGKDRELPARERETELL